MASFFGDSNPNTFEGTADDDFVDGMGGDDVLFGAGGNDHLQGGPGRDLLSGGDGIDTVSYSSSASAVIVSLAWRPGISDNWTGDARQDTILGVERVIGSAFNDTLSGTDGDNVINGSSGADLMIGLNGNDNYHVDNLSDVVIETVGGGFDTILIWVDEAFTLAGGLEVEWIAAFHNSVPAMITGNDFGQRISGDSGNNVLDGAGGNDVLDGLLGDDTLHGGFGNDTFIGGPGSDFIDAGPGIDTIDYSGSPGPVTAELGKGGRESDRAIDTLLGLENIVGSPFADTLTGDAGDNVILGGAGADRLNGGSGADTMAGGATTDWYYVDNAADQIIETAERGSFDRVLASVSYTLPAGAEIEILATPSVTDFDSINLTGNEFFNAIAGNAGDNVLDGRGGADQMIGLMGNDSYFVDNAGDQVIDTVVQNTFDRVFASVSYTLAAGDPGTQIEILSMTDHAGTGSINLTGNEYVDTIYGNAGPNTLDGKGAADVLVGLGGDDMFYVDDAADVVIEGAGEGLADRVLTSVSYTLGAAAQVEKLTTTDSAGTAGLALTGNAFANTIYGNAGANTLDGGGGADTLLGLGGDDRFMVDNTSDAVIEMAGEGLDQVFASVDYALGAGRSIEVLSTTSSSGTTNLTLIGNELDNAVMGNAGSNAIKGLAGNDVLYGGGGIDAFVFNSALSVASNVDAIIDFSPAEDDIYLSGGIFTAIAPGMLAAVSFVIGTSAGDASDRIIYNSATGAVFYDSDGLGGGPQLQFAILSAGLAVTNSDFIVA